MKVAVLAHSFPRFAGDTHGPFVKSLSEEISRRGHEVTALVPFDPELAHDPETPLAVRSFRYVWPDSLHLLGYSRTLKRDVGLKTVAFLEAPLYFHFAERALERLVREQGIEMIHAHWILPNGYVASRVARRTGVPYCATLHGSDVFMAERNRFFGWMAARALEGAAHVTSCSGELRDRLLKLGGEKHSDKVLLVANGTDVVPRPKSATAGGARKIVAVGRLVYKKGFRYLLEAAPEILRADPEVRIVIGGGGDLEAELRGQARQLGIAERVDFPGQLSHPEVLELLADAEIVVMPSIRDPRGNVDGLPIVVLEAMAAGKPVVATDVSGIPMAIQDGVTGVLVEEKDAAALAAAVRDLLATPERGRVLGEAARGKVSDELNWRSVAQIHDRLYRAAVSKEGSVAC